MNASPTPVARSARITILHRGYVGRRVASTVSYVEDGPARIVIDPGMVASDSAILAPLARLRVRPASVTDVILSHHHPDHTLRTALFPYARVHDHWAIYSGDRWISRPAEGFAVSPSVRLWETPGHTPQDITTLVGTARDVFAFTHLWWNARGPTPDPLAADNGSIRRHRRRVLGVATAIVPGHGAPFRTRYASPR